MLFALIAIGYLIAYAEIVQLVFLNGRRQPFPRLVIAIMLDGFFLIYVKQRKTHTGEVETLKYTLSSEQIKPTKTQNSYDEQFNALRRDIERINDVLGVKIKKEVKDEQ